MDLNLPSMSPQESYRAAPSVGAPTLASAQQSLSDRDRQELESADWLLVEPVHQCRKCEGPSRATLETTDNEDSTTVCRDSLGNSNSSIGRNCSGQSDTRLRAARTRLRIERRRLRECYSLQRYNIDRYTHDSSNRVMAAESSHGLQQQARTDLDITLKQADVVEAVEKEILLLESELFDEEQLSWTSSVKPGIAGLIESWTPPLVESYLRRCGDAFIARERLDELAFELSAAAAGDAQAACSFDFDGAHLAAEISRRDRLELDLRCATRDIEALKAACWSQNLDPEQSRYR